jgi:hypothetical protein
VRTHASLSSHTFQQTRDDGDISPVAHARSPKDQNTTTIGVQGIVHRRSLADTAQSVGDLEGGP